MIVRTVSQIVMIQTIAIHKKIKIAMDQVLAHKANKKEIVNQIQAAQAHVKNKKNDKISFFSIYLF
jgi:hypothetical protein